MARRRGRKTNAGILEQPILPRRVMRFNEDIERYEYHNVMAPIGNGTVPKENPKAEPEGRLKNVHLGEIAKFYNNERIKVIDFRPPLMGEWFLQNSGRTVGVKMVKCEMGIGGKRLIFAVLE